MMSKDSMNGKDVPKRIEEVKNWDSITISLLVLAGILFVFSFFAPALFVKTASNPNLDFSKTGEIGDTIGGIMNPFIALVAVVLTFLAFYMQIKANQIQRKIFYDGVKEEKAKVLREQRFDWYYKLSLLQIDLENIIVDVNTKSEELKKYFEIEKKYPFRTNFLFRTPLRNYSRILELDRLSIYKGYKNFFNHIDNWLKQFNNLYSILDFLPENFKDIYNKYDNHSKDLFEKKNEVRNNLIKLMNLGSSLLTDYKQNYAPDDYLEQPASSITNIMMRDYYNCLNENFDENGNVISETDLEKIGNVILKTFIQKVLDQRENPDTYDRKLEPISEMASNIRKQLFLIKQLSIQFANSVEDQYNQINIDTEDKKSIVTRMTEIKDLLNSELKKIKIDNF